MGFDINGLSPNPDIIGEDGEPIGTYFRNNVWWWRKMWGLLGGVSEYVYRKQNNLDMSKIPNTASEHKMFLKEWREIWGACEFNDGQEVSGKYLALLEDALEYALENRDTKDMKQFIEYLDDQLGEEYQFEWYNVEEFQEFVVNSGGFTVW